MNHSPMRCGVPLCLLALWTGDGRADVALEPQDLTATVAPVRLPMAGRWQRLDTAYEKETLVVSRGGQVSLGEPGRAVAGRCTGLSADTIQLDFRSKWNLFGSSGRRFTCRWRLQDSILTLEILESMSQASPDAEFHVLDVDRSAVGETWRFQRAR
jgi:hypothetical protein